jgi:methylated-DNA-[protein]-cysteine S-methyltransferase
MPLLIALCNSCMVNMFYAFAAPAVVDGPWGPVRLAATARGVVAVELLSSDEGFAAGLARRGVVVDAEQAGRRAAALAAEAAALIGAMLEGESVDATALPIDIGDRPAWDRLVLEAVRAIPRGHTAGYGEVARRIGRPGAARAVGGAVGRNPVGLLVPCHRVIAGDGTLGGYGAAAWGGREAALDLKRELLTLEGVTFDRGRVSAR